MRCLDGRALLDGPVTRRMLCNFEVAGSGDYWKVAGRSTSHPPLASLRLLAPPYAARRGRSLGGLWCERVFGWLRTGLVAYD